jgi:Fe-S-cluster-containing hydrogenase component 2
MDVCPVDCIYETSRMLVINPEECIDCGACEPECPVEAIIPEDTITEAWKPFLAINAAYPDIEGVERLLSERERDAVA